MSVDFSAITGNINYDASQIAGINLLASVCINLLASVCIVGMVFLFLVWLLGKSKSKEYRELLSDLFVVGMIKKYAKEESIDLIAELREYSIIRKRSKLRLKDLDEVIESELKEKIAKVNEDKIDKK